MDAKKDPQVQMISSDSSDSSKPKSSQSKAKDYYSEEVKDIVQNAFKRYEANTGNNSSKTERKSAYSSDRGLSSTSSKNYNLTSSSLRSGMISAKQADIDLHIPISEDEPPTQASASGTAENPLFISSSDDDDTHDRPPKHGKPHCISKEDTILGQYSRRPN